MVPFRVPIQWITFPEPVTGGMNAYVLMSLAYMYRSTNEDTEPVELICDNGCYAIADGRHRVVASMMAGRKSVLAYVTNGDNIDEE